MKALFLILFISPLCFAEVTLPKLAPGQSQTTIPFRLTSPEHEEYKDQLNLQLGVKKQYHSKLLDNTVSIETNFSVPLYEDVNEFDWQTFKANDIITPLKKPEDVEFGINFKLFF